MLRIIYLSLALFTFVLGTSPSYGAAITEFLPQDQNYLSSVPTPESVLGYGLGEHHPRHDQLVDYFQTLANSSTKIIVTNIGRTAQLRKQQLLTISSPDNLNKLNQILANRHIPFRSVQDNSDAEQKADEPLVIWLGYSVHGDEASGASAAMAVAYHLVASTNADVEQMLKNTIIVMEPSINPDGLDRFVNWVTTYRGRSANDDPDHIEHHQGWMTGRTNHFGFDLNRDWLLLTQQESRHRLKYFHLYQPHVLGDFHEMGRNSSYFFQPGVPTRNHPLTPTKNTELTKTLAQFHAKSLDAQQRLYYSEENFDDFYYGKGSTYPDINGSVGILFEQASSRGFQQQTINGLLTFEFGIQNHVLTSLSTIEGAWQNKEQLKQYRQDFYRQGLKLADKEKTSGYLISAGNDPYRLTRFLDTLAQHQIKAYPLTSDFRHNSKLFNQNSSFYVPLKQSQYRVIQALFNQQTNFKDNTFYDVSGWTLPLAMNIEFHPVERTWGLKLAKTAWVAPIPQPQIAVKQNAYAYVFNWQNSLAPKLLNNLLNAGIKARVATKPFSAKVDNKIQHFASGSILIAAAWQQLPHWQTLMNQASQQSNIKIAAIDTGLTPQGIDLGSGSFKVIKPLKALLLGGKGISQYEAGEIRYYLDELLSIPLSIVEQQRFSSLKLNNYSHLILVDGNYSDVSKQSIAILKTWLNQGGVVFAQKRAAKWLAEQEILQASFVSKNQLTQMFATDELSYQDKEALSARKRIAGAIFAATVDTSHPLFYGANGNNLPLFKNSSLIMKRPSQPFITPASYNAKPLLSGYADRNLTNSIAHSAAVIAHNVGKGRVIATTDDMAFRGYWLGSARVLANSLFFAKAFSVKINNE